MPIANEIKLEIRKYAIKNAVEYGKAEQGPVLNKVISLHPQLKADIKTLAIEVKKEIGEINSMAKDSLEAEYSKYSEEFGKAQKEKATATAKPKFVLEGAVSGDFATRYPPAPNGYMHIGHAKAAFLEAEFARIYNGKLFLYFDDTNPEKDKKEFVDQFHRDLDWLGIKFDGEYYASDEIEKMYEYAKVLIKDGNAYACMCDSEKIKKERFSGVECEHRNRPAKESMEALEGMLNGKYGENDVIIRLKADMKNDNTSLRDPTMLRIKDTPHYRQGTKYRVWPTYDFNTPIMDSTHGLTAVLRSKEFELRDDLSKLLLTSLSLRVPRIHSFSRLVIKDNITHKRELNKLISEGMIQGFDDPRLVTIVALRKRGIMPQAIREFVLRFGMSKTDGEVSIDMLLAENRKIIDPIAKHLFFVANPVKITVQGAQETAVKLKLHPNSSASREYSVKNDFYISKQDADMLNEGDTLRLKDLMDVKITAKGQSGISAQKSDGTSRGKVIQWVAESNFERCSVLEPGQILDENEKFNPDSLSTAEGYVESYAKNLKEHEVVQFERFGYCILDDKGSMKFILTSK